MLNLLISIIGIVLTILIIVGFHELGHFVVARLAGVKVLRFSIGFGKSLFRWHDKKGTEYVIAAIPLGGYVKMLDENEGAVPTSEKHLAFNQQNLLKKSLIVAAGPIANFILAFALYWLLFVVGVTTLTPVIGKVAHNSIAAKAGIEPQQEILSIDQIPTNSWLSVAIRVLTHTGDKDTIEMRTRNMNTQRTETYALDVTHWRLDNLRPDPLGSLGIIPYEPKVPAVIHKIQSDSPAATANLQPNDRIIAIDNRKISDWYELSEIIDTHPGKSMQFTVKRGKETLILPVLIGTQTHFFAKSRGYLGISPQFNWPKNFVKETRFGVLQALPHAWRNTADFTYLNFMMIGKLITGKVSLQSLGGPISIFQGAGSAFHEGITPFFGFLAFLSISIGIINILPIPGLDGGHLLLQFIEFVTRRPIPERVLNLAYRFGIILLLLLIFQAVMNDILRLT